MLDIPLISMFITDINHASDNQASSSYHLIEHEWLHKT